MTKVVFSLSRKSQGSEVGKYFSEPSRSLGTTWEPGPTARPQSSPGGQPMAAGVLPALKGSLAHNTVLQPDIPRERKTIAEDT